MRKPKDKRESELQLMEIGKDQGTLKSIYRFGGAWTQTHIWR